MSYNLRQAKREPEAIQSARDDLNAYFGKFKSVGELAADVQGVFHAGSLIRQLAQEQFSLVDPTPQFFERKPGPGLGNWLEFEEYVNTGKVTERSLGGKAKTYTPAKKKYTITLKDLEVNFAFELEQILTGQMLASVWVDHMAEAISRYYVEAGLNCLDLACTTGTLDAYGAATRTVIGGVVTQAGLDGAIKRLNEVTTDITIAGRYSALFPILGFTGFSIIAQEEYRQQGMIAIYKGAKITVLRDTYNPFFKKASVPATRIYLTGADKGGVLVEDDMSALDYQVVDQEEQHFRVGTKLRANFKVFKPWKYHVIEVQ